MVSDWKKRRDRDLFKGGVNTAEAVGDGMSGNYPGAIRHGARAGYDFYKAVKVKPSRRRVHGKTVKVKGYTRRRPGSRGRR